MTLIRASNRRKLDELTSATDKGAKLDGTSDDSAALTTAAAAAASRTGDVLLHGPANAPTLDLATVADTTFRGKAGNLRNAYRKWATPDNSPGDDMPHRGVIASKHLRQLNQAAKPVVVLVGDSISTYFANSVARGDMLSEVLRRTLEAQFPNGVTFYNRAIGGKTWNDLQTTQYAATIPWYAGQTGTAWLTMVQNLAPDLVVFSFGMNDSGSVRALAAKAVIDAVQGWTKKPSIVMASCLVPSPASVNFPEGQTGQEGRDRAAGFVRSYAKFRGVGLLDMHRRACMVRDGFDPASSCITKGDTVATVPSGNADIALGTKTATDWKARLNFDATAWSAANFITLKTGPGQNDFIQLLKPAAGQLQVAAYAGDVDALPYYSQTVSFTPGAGVGWHLVVEKTSDGVSIYTDTDTQFGTYNEPVLTFPCVALGGIYTPKAESNNGDVLRNVEWGYGVPRINRPSITNRLLWGDESQAIDVHGGSGWNHPGGFAATHIYRPLVEAVEWHQRTEPNGVQAVGSGVASVVVNLPSPEIDTTYTVLLSEEGSDMGARYRVGAKNTTSFTVNFNTATTGAGGLVWRIVRRY